MVDPILEWDAAKAHLNEKKHGVPFVFAGRVFKDRNRVEKADPKHSIVEARYLVIGAVEGAILSVTFTRRGRIIRLISARAASRKERQEYHTGSA
jgi:uncharacterized DUF497 family protein